MTAKTEIAERLRAIMAKELKKDLSSITPAHTLQEDLGLNSLDAIELMFKIEEEFDLSIPDKDMQTLTRVGDVINYLHLHAKQLPAKEPSAKAVAPPTMRVEHSGKIYLKSDRHPRAAGEQSPKTIAPRSGTASRKKTLGTAHNPKLKRASGKPSKPARTPGKNPKSKGARRHA